MIKNGIPNAFTLGNLFCGFLSIVFSASGDLKNAALLIIIGMMLDSMDGRLARILKVESSLGKELDSLSDVVSFGVAPAILVYYISFSQHGFVGLVIAGLFPLFGAYRLARFNIEKNTSNSHFTGVPITAAGGILTVLCTLHQWIPNIILDASFMALCFLMISKYKIASFKNIPLPRYGTIITILLGCTLFLIYKSKHSELPYFIYVAVPLYIAFISYRLIKRKDEKNRKNQNK